MAKTCENYQTGVTLLAVLLALAASSILVIGGGIAANNLKEKGLVNVNSATIKNILYQQTGFLDAKKVNSSVIDGSVVGTVVLPNGSFSAYKLVDGGVEDNGNSFTGETKIQFLSGDNGLGTYDGGIIIPFYLKSGVRTTGVVMDRMIANLRIQGTSYPVKVLQGNVKNGKLTGDFVAQTVDTGYIIGGTVGEKGIISRASVTSGGVKATEAQISIAFNALSLFREISTVFGISDTKVLAENTVAPSVYGVAGFNKPIFDSKTGTWIFLSPTAATTGVISTSVTQNIVNYLQNLSQQTTSIYQNLPSYLQTPAQVIQGITGIESTNSKLTVSTSGNTAELSLDLTGITAAGINDGTINKAKLVSSNDASNGQCLTYNSSTGGFTWSSCGTAGGVGTITGVTAGNGLTGGGTSGALSLALNIQSGGGLSATASGLSLLRTCGDGELLKWTSSTSSWDCAIDVGGAGGGISTLKVDGTTAVSSASILNFSGSDFDLTNSPTGQGNLSIDYTNSKIVRSDQTQSITGIWTFSTAPVISTISNTGTITLPAATDTLVGRATSDTLTNKTIAAGSNTISGLTNSNLSGTAGITNVNLANSAVTINSSGILSGGATVSLGGTLTLTATEADTLSSITGRGATTATGLTLSSAAPINFSGTTPTITFSGGDTIFDLTGAATRTLSILNSTSAQVAGLSVEGTIAASNFSGSSSGSNTGDQTITLTGNVTGSGTGSFATTIASGAVTLSNMANLAANSIIGNNTGSPATPLALTASQVKTLLGIATSDISGLGTIATQSASNIFITGGNISGIVSLNGAAITGGTISGGSLSSTAVNGITTANIALTSGSYSDPSWITSLSETKVLPSQTGNSGKVLGTNGTSTSWITNSSGVAWGAITGLLNDQTDLNASLSAKLSKTLTSANIFVGNGSNVATGVSVSGDISIDNTGLTAIGSGAVSLTKMANLAANSIIGNNTGSPATPLALTASQVKTLLGIATSDVSGLGTIATQSASNVYITGGNMSGLNSISATTFTGALTGNATSATTANALANSDSAGQSAITAINSASTGTINAARIASLPYISTTLTSANIIVGNGSNVATGVAMTGDISIDNTGLTAIGSGKVLLAKMANLAANSIIGNNTGSPATPLALTASQVKTLLGISTSDISGLGTIATQSASNVYITGGNMSGLVSVAATTFTGALTGNASTVTGFSPVSGKTLTVQKSMTLTSADDTGVYTLPTGTKTLVATDVSTLSSLTSIGTLGSLSVTGAISGATATNTINGLIINSGALSGATTLGLSGAITGATATNTINGMIINTGAVSGVTTLGASSTVTIGSGGNTYTLDPTGTSGIAYAGTVRPTRKETMAPEYQGAVLTGTGIGTMTSDFCDNNATNGITDVNTGDCNTDETHNFYKWTTSQGTTQTYSIFLRWRIPDNFPSDGFSAATNPIQVYGRRSDATNGSIKVYVYDTTGALNNAGGTEVAGAANTWVQNGINVSGGTWTAGSYMTIKIDLTAAASGGTSYTGEINLNYRSTN